VGSPFVAVDLVAAVFLAPVLLPVDFLVAAGCSALVVFLAAVLLAAVLLAVVFLAADFLVAVFFAADFLAAVDVEAVFLADWELADVAAAVFFVVVRVDVLLVALDSTPS